MNIKSLIAVGAGAVLGILATFFFEITGIGKPSAPFVPLPSDAVSGLVKHIHLDTQSVVYDLGCGDGRILYELYRVYRTGKYVGVDRGFVPYLLAQWKVRHISPQSIRIIRGDVFTTDVTDATIVIT